MKRPKKSGSDGSKKPKLYEIGSPCAGSSTMSASWPKRSQKICPGSMVITPMRMAGVGVDTDGAAAAVPASSRTSNASSQRNRLMVSMHADMQRVQATGVCACNPETESAQRQFLAGFRQVPDGGCDQAADGVVLVIVEVRAESLVEIRDRRQCIDCVLAVGLRGDQCRGVFGFVMFVVDLADDLLQHVLDRHQSGHAAVLVDDDGHVVARLAEFAQQHVELLGFGDQDRRSQQFAHVDWMAAVVVVGDDAAQQVLGQQDPEDLVAVLAMHGESRVPGFHHMLEQLDERI